MYSEVCARCEFWEECETGEAFCTFELCIHFPEELRDYIEEQSDTRMEDEPWLEEVGEGER